MDISKNTCGCELVPVADAAKLSENGIPFSRGTLRKWFSLGRNPQIFIKVEGRLFISLPGWRKFVEEARVRTEARATKRFESLAD